MKFEIKPFFNIEEESENRLILTGETKRFPKIMHFIAYFICIFIISITMVITVLLPSKNLDSENPYFWMNTADIFFIPFVIIIIIGTLIFLYDIKSNKIRKLIIDKENQKIIYYKNYLKPGKINEYSLDTLAAIEIKSIVTSEDVSKYKIYLVFSINKLKIFDDTGTREELIDLSKELLKYLNVNFIENRGLGAKKAILIEDIFTDFFYCLYCGTRIKISDQIEYCPKCRSKYQNKIEIEKLQNIRMRNISLTCPSCEQFYLIQKMIFKNDYKGPRIILIVKCINHNFTQKIIFPYQISPNDISFKMYRIIAGNMCKCEKCDEIASLIETTKMHDYYLLHILTPNHGSQKRLVSSIFFPKIEEIYKNSKEIREKTQITDDN